MLDLDLLARTPATSAPFPHLVLPRVLSRVALEAVSQDFPAISKPGLFPLSALQVGGAFARLVDEICGRDLEAAMERCFDIDLRGRPLMVTVRGQCQRRDGRIHNDSKDKLVTCLLYLNAPWWPEKGGRLRLLRDRRDLNSTIAEVSPEGGAFVAFKRTENSWHGHAPYTGPRRYIMFNWLRSEAAMGVNTGRHVLSSFFKSMGPPHVS